jgi:hypothetical protein
MRAACATRGARKIPVPTSAGCWQKWSELLTLESAYPAAYGAGSLVHCGGAWLRRFNGGADGGCIIRFQRVKTRSHRQAR